MNSITTIVTDDYFAKYKILERSILKYHPELDIVVLNLGTKTDFDPKVKIYTINDVPTIDFLGYWNKNYDEFEQATSCKPGLILFNLQKLGYEQTIFMDSDCVLFGRLDEVLNDKENNSWFTPHIITPMYPNDGKLPSFPQISLAGQMNTGFVGMRNIKENKSFLVWMSITLGDRCKKDIKNGIFVDQTWFNFAFSLLDKVKIIRHPGYNMAYWNILGRKLDDIRFVHFSGFDPEHPEKMSKYQNRYLLDPKNSHEAKILQLFLDYKKELGE